MQTSVKIFDLTDFLINKRERYPFDFVSSKDFGNVIISNGPLIVVVVGAHWVYVTDVVAASKADRNRSKLDFDVDQSHLEMSVD